MIGCFVIRAVILLFVGGNLNDVIKVFGDVVVNAFYGSNVGSYLAVAPVVAVVTLSPLFPVLRLLFFRVLVAEVVGSATYETAWRGFA